MTNVISLHEEEPKMCWVCNCGCSTFMLLSDGTAECAVCDSVPDLDGVGGWSELEKTSEVENPHVDVQGNGSVEFARMRVAMLAAQDDAELLIVARSCGTVHAWSSAESDEQMEWIKEKADQGRDLLCDVFKSITQDNGSD